MLLNFVKLNNTLSEGIAVMVLEKLLTYDKFQKEIEMKEQSQIQVVNMKKNKI